MEQISGSIDPGRMTVPGRRFKPPGKGNRPGRGPGAVPKIFNQPLQSGVIAGPKGKAL